MNETSVLGQVALGYSAIVDARRQVLGHRLSLSLPRPDVALDTAALLGWLAKAWPAPVGTSASPGQCRKGSLVVNVAGEAMLCALLQSQAQAPNPGLVIEVPTFLMSDPSISAAVGAAQAAGARLWAKGRGSVEVGRAMPGWFTHVVCELPDAPPANRGNLQAVVGGVGSLAELDDAVRKGASMVAGWPLIEVKVDTSGRQKVAPELQVVTELIARIDREEPVEKLEATLKGDASLAFRLLRYLNSAAFGLSVEVTSFRHALMMLGYGKLKRWLALLLMSASKDPNQLPVMHAALRRGLLMEELGRSLGDAEMSSELFLCGVFSLLDRMMQQPFAALFRSVPMPERVRQALGEQQGPFVPYLGLVAAVESGSPFDRQEAAEALMLDMSDVNRALLAALTTARSLEA